MIEQTRYQVTIRVGLWIPPYLQGTALWLERKALFKECVDQELKRYLDLRKLIRPTKLVLTKADDDVGYKEIHRHLETRLDDSRVTDYEIVAAPHPVSAACSPPDDPKKPWIKGLYFGLQWPIDDSWSLDWRCGDVVNEFERRRTGGVYGPWLRSKLCSIPLSAYVRLS